MRASRGPGCAQPLPRYPRIPTPLHQPVPILSPWIWEQLGMCQHWGWHWGPGGDRAGTEGRRAGTRQDMEVPGWRCPVAHGFLCPTAEPLAVLRNEPGATRAAMREPCSLPYSHIPLILWGQCQHRDNSSAGPRDLEMVSISLIAGWAGRCIQDAQEHQRHRMVLPGSTRDPSAPWYLPQGTGDPDSPVPPG